MIKNKLLKTRKIICQQYLSCPNCGVFAKNQSENDEDIFCQCPNCSCEFQIIYKIIKKGK